MLTYGIPCTRGLRAWIWGIWEPSDPGHVYRICHEKPWRKHGCRSLFNGHDWTSHGGICSIKQIMYLGIKMASLTPRRKHLTEHMCGFFSVPEQMGALVACNMDGFVSLGQYIIGSTSSKITCLIGQISSPDSATREELWLPLVGMNVNIFHKI